MQLVRYSEIIAIPKESRTIREHILVLAYEKMLSYRNDIEALRHERDISRFTHFPYWYQPLLECVFSFWHLHTLSYTNMVFGALSGWCDSEWTRNPGFHCSPIGVVLNPGLVPTIVVPKM